MWRTLARSTLAFSLALVLACQPAAQPTPTPAPGEPTPAPSPTELTLTMVFSATVDFLDPHVSRRSEGIAVLAHTHEGLVARDRVTAELLPGLATSWTQPDANTWLFTLRQGVTFHNGEAFDAEVVKYTFERVVVPELNSAIGATLATIVENVEVVDQYTARVTTNVPAPWFLERIARLRMMPPQETEERGDEYVAANPVGTGPYRFVEWVSGQHVVLERNPDYWGDLPAYNRLVFREIVETSTAVAELLTGRVDILAFVPPDLVDVVNASGVATVKAAPLQGHLEIALDGLGRSGPTPFQDARVRQAVWHAVDRQTIADTIMGGYTEPTASFLNPLVFGHDPTLEPVPYDPDRARELLAEAGYPDGFDTVLNVYPLGVAVESSEVGQAVAAYLAEVGIRAEIRFISSADIGPRVREGQAGPMYIRHNSCAGTYDAALCFAFLRVGSIFAYYGDERLDEMAERAASETDPQERLRLYAEIQRFVQEEAAIGGGWANFANVAVANHVDWDPWPTAEQILTNARPK